MSALIGLVSFLVFVAGLGAAYRVWEKRSTRRESDSFAPEAPQTPNLTIPPPAAAESSSIAPERSVPEAVPKAIEPPSPVTEPAESSLPIAAAEPALEEAIQNSPSLSAEPMEAIATPEDLAPENPPQDSIAPEIVPDIVPVESAAAKAPAVTIAPSELSQAAAVGSEYLSEKIALAGRSRQLRQAPYLFRYASHSDSTVRAAVATALGAIAANRRGAEVEAIVSILGKLSQDTKPAVRLQAVEALGKIRSAIVLPWLQRAQRQSDSAISQSAATAIQRLKFIQQAKKPIAQKPMGRQAK